MIERADELPAWCKLRGDSDICRAFGLSLQRFVGTTRATSSAQADLDGSPLHRPQGLD